MAGHVSPDVADIKASMTEAAENGLFVEIGRRSPMKLQDTSPRLAVCIPVGVKDDPDVYHCPHCNRRTAKIERLRHAGLIPVEFFMNMVQIVPPLLVSMHYFFRKSVPSALAREEMTQAARDIGCKYIFYLDDDVILPSHAIYDLYNMMELHPEAGIITGVYSTRQDCTEPILYRKHGEGSYWEFSTVPGVLEPGFASGAGCMIARVEALDDVERIMGRPFWDDERTASPTDPTSENTRFMWGHDIRFCKRMIECGDRYKEEADIGLMYKEEAMAIATEQLQKELGGEIPDGKKPAIAKLANKILVEAREKRSITLIEAESARQPWEVYLAGWIQCGHFDYMRQKMFHLPPDAPCFRNSNTRGYWDHAAEKEAAARAHGSSERRGSEAWLHSKVADLVPVGSKVIDIGCFMGALGDLLIKTKQCRYFGIDISDKAIAELRRSHMSGVAADIGRITELEDVAGDEIFTCLEVLEHLDDDRLKNAVRHLAKGKMAIVSVPDGKLPAPHAEHVREFDENSLFDLLKPHFKEVKVQKVEPHFLLAVCSKEGSDGAGSSVVQVEHDEPLHAGHAGDGSGKLRVDHG